MAKHMKGNKKSAIKVGPSDSTKMHPKAGKSHLGTPGVPPSHGCKT
jgi:hypothetical protein